MLVYYYIPKGYAGLNGKHIYGNMTGHPPRRISYSEYREHKAILVQAPYTTNYIEKTTGRKFPLKMSFTLNTLKTLDYRTLQKFATFFGTDALLTHRKLLYAVRKAVREL